MSLFLTLFCHLFTLNNVLQIKQYRYGALSSYNLNVMINKFIYHKDFQHVALRCGWLAMY